MRHNFYATTELDKAVASRKFTLEEGILEPARTNCFVVFWFRDGSGTLSVDDLHVDYSANDLAFITPYQYLRLDARGFTKIEAIEFHANFLCVETFHSEVGCSGTLFNDPQGNPLVPIQGANVSEISSHFESLQNELSHCDLAYLDAALARLKLLLILAARCKSMHSSEQPAKSSLPEVVSQFLELVESHYGQWHSPADYANALHITPKTLGRLAKAHLGISPTEFVRRRFLIHAKWQLLHTLRPVKEIAREIGFQDELYFSRLFRKTVGVSPTYFREFETKIREGRNLSMPLE